LYRTSAACVCGNKTRRGPPAALPGLNRAIVFGVNRNKREVNDFGIKSQRGLPAVMLGTDVWRNTWSDGAYCPCAARYAARYAANDNIFPMAVLNQAQLFPRGGLHQTVTTTQSKPRNSF
jgi:hypothetical protein